MPDTTLGNEDIVGKDKEKKNTSPKRAYVIVRDAVTKINILE